MSAGKPPIDVVLLRFDAPMMSFGGHVIDSHNRTERFPDLSMLTGLVANALGFDRTETPAATYQALQLRLRYAARCDRRGVNLVDYQTVNLQPDGPMYSELAWTEWSALERRKGAPTDTHVRLRHYWADAVLTVAITLDPCETGTSLRQLSDALRAPARPLFLGRKCCIPSAPVWLGELSTSSLRQALEETPRVAGLRPGDPQRGDYGPLLAVWPYRDGPNGHATTTLWRLAEERDYTGGIHVGRARHLCGLVSPPFPPPPRQALEVAPEAGPNASERLKESA